MLQQNRVIFTCALFAFTLSTSAALPVAGPTCNHESTTSTVSSAFTFLETVSRLTRDLNSNIGANEVNRLCQDGQLLKSYQTFISKCLALNVPGIHEIMAGSVKLLDVCKTNNQAEIVINLETKQACERKLASSVPTFPACLTKLSKTFEGLEQAAKKPDFISKGLQLSTVCCALKNYDDCLGQHYQKLCSGQSVQVIRKFLDGMYGAFNCYEEFPLC